MKYNRRLRRNRIRKYGLGGLIGGLIGKAAGSLIPIPGVGTAIGSAAGSFLGNKVEGLFSKKKGSEASVDPQTAALPIGADCGVVNTQGGLGNINMRTGGRLADSIRSKRLKGKAVEFVGPSHEAGGIPLPGFEAEVEGGETLDFFMRGGKLRKRSGRGELPYVFSSTLKVPGSNMTFADQHKALLKRKGSEGDIMRLAARQEKLNGGNVGYKKQEGGFFSDILGGLGKAASYARENIFTDENLKKAGEIGKTILPYLPAALAVGRGLQKTNVPTITPTRIDRSSLAEVNRMPTTVDVSPQLARASASYRSILAGPNTSTNAALAAHAANLQNEAEILGGKRNIETDLLAKKALRRSDLSADFATREAAAQDQANLINMENRMGAEAAREGMLMGGLQGIANVFAGQQRDIQFKKRDEEIMNQQPLALAASLASMTPEARRYYLKVLKDFAPEKYREVFDRLSKDPSVEDIPEATPGISAPVYGGQGYQTPANLG